MACSYSSCVKLYLCSNPADSIVERKALKERVFPKLREHCRHKAGVDFRVIDPYESSDPICWPDENSRKQLIKECRESSTGPFLMALVGHQYGTSSLPVQVEVTEFQHLLQESQQAGISTKELERVYQRDENTIPPSYCLTLPHTCSPQVKEGEDGKVENEEDVKKVFQTAVSLRVLHGRLTPEKAQSYNRSALDIDLRFALEDCSHHDIIGRCVVYINKVVNAKSERQTRQAVASELTTTQETELLSELCDVFLHALITSRQLLVYTTTTECDHRYGYTTARRRGYAESLCLQVYSDLVKLIDSSENSGVYHLSGALAREQAEQEEICDILSTLYDVERQEEDKIRSYVEQNDLQCPLVVTGGPCSGKTVLLAHCARKIKSWIPHSDTVVIIYFSNLSINPSPTHLLVNLCYQITRNYNYPSSPQDSMSSNPGEHISSCSSTANWKLKLRSVPHPELGAITNPDISLSEVREHLFSLISTLPSTKQPLVLILDGMDQIGKTLSVQIINSLPSPLPPGVKLILSVMPSQTHIVQAIKLHYPECTPCVTDDSMKESGYMCVTLGPADRKQCVKMLMSLLSSSGRRVTSGQQALVNKALSCCCLTLYARLLHTHLSLWRSDSDVTETSLPNAVHSSIAALLDHLEQKHTSCLVACAVSYLTLSRSGLTEAELADLTLYEQGWCPSSDVKVLQVDVERLMLDLKSYLIRRTFAGSPVMFWVSRHFGLVVAKRYLGTPEVRRKIHSEMADYFWGKWACVSAKPLLEKWKSEPNEDIVLKSSLEELVNSRKVMELLHHLQESGRWEMKNELLMSFKYHQVMVRAGLLGDLVAMLRRQEGSPTFSRERALLMSILKSSACLLRSSPLGLAALMESTLLPYLQVFPALRGYDSEIRQGRQGTDYGLGVLLSPAPSAVASIQSLQCDTRTGDVSVTEVAGTECGMVTVVLDDGSAWVWEDSGCDIVKLSVTCEQRELKFMGVKSSGQFLLLSTQCDRLFMWNVTGPEMFLEVPLKTEPCKQMPSKIKGFVECQKKLYIWWRGESFVGVFCASSHTLTHLHCQSSVTCLVCSSSGSYMHCGQDDGTVSVFDTDSFSLLHTCSNSNHSAIVSILRKDKQVMTCIDRTGGITVWDMTTNTQSPRLVKDAFCEGEFLLNTDYSDEINALLVCQKKQVTMWDTCDWELRDQFLAPQGRSFMQALLSQDGHLFLALLETCPRVLVWSISTGRCVLSLNANMQPLTLLKMASDITCVSQGGCFQVWDAEMIYAAGVAPKMGYGITEVVVEQSGLWFYTTDGSDAVWRWSLEMGLPHSSFLHDGPVKKLRVSLDNVHLVVLSAGEIYVWRTEMGQNILRISGSRATDILITPNSNFGVSLSKQGLSKVWKLAHGGVVCSIHQYLSDAQVSSESTFLIGCHCGDLLAASLWSGLISKRFSCVENPNHVVAFQTLTEHPDFVVVMVASGAVYTWKVSDDTVCRHFQLPETFYCQPQDFQMSFNGSCALLSTDNESITLLDLSQVRLCSLKVEGSVLKACLDKTGSYASYISHPSTMEESCACYQHAKPILTVVQLSDGTRVGSMFLPKNPSTLVMWEQQCVFVGFEDGSMGVYTISDVMMSRESSVRRREHLNPGMKECPFDKVPLQWLPLATPNFTWP
ncbi:NACHT and WD repeat domain-containing protein 2 [Aulostomus maculatus]